MEYLKRKKMTDAHTTKYYYPELTDQERHAIQAIAELSAKTS